MRSLYRWGIALVAPALVAWAAAAPLEVGSRRQVFINGRFLTAVHGVTLEVHPPRKTEEMTLNANHPAQTLIDRDGTVLYTDGVYRMWYASFQRSRDVWPAGQTHTDTEPFPLTAYPCYAQSTDGVHWAKPNLGVPPPYPGAEPNIMPIVDEHGRPLAIYSIGMVFLDPTAPPDARFRMVCREHGRTYGWLDILSSADGEHWRRTEQDVLTYHGRRHQLDSPNVIFWDNRIDRYVAYIRRNLHEPDDQGRTIARSVSGNLAHFPDVEKSPIVFKWDMLDPHAVDRTDGRTVELVDFYNSSAIKYAGAQDAYYMFPSGYYHYLGGVQQVFAKEAPTNAGTTDIRFAASRDGIHWHRYHRRAFVPDGMRGSFDSMLLFMFRGVVPAPDGRHLYMYYTGSDRCHGWDRDVRNQRILRAAGLAPIHHDSYVSRLVLRKEGFISAHAAYTGGQFTTPTLRFRGDELVLNVDTSAGGEVRVEIEDAHGIPVPGFALEDADMINSTNAINCRVTWRGRWNVGALAGRPVRLRFVMRDADLYAFQFRQAAHP